MMRGVVNDRLEANLPLRVVGLIGEVEVTAAIDTGFTGSLTLPHSVIARLGLLRTSRSSAFLADGSEQEFDVYSAEVEWDRTRRRVLVSALGSEILLGMSMLANFELRIEVEPNGVVELRKLRPHP